MWDIPDVSDPARRGKNLGYIYGGGFSAYRIYINGELAGEVGDPDEKPIWIGS